MNSPLPRVPLIAAFVSVVMIALVSPTSWAEAVTAGLIGHWKLDETDASSTVVKNSANFQKENGKRTASTAINQPTPAGAGYLFDGRGNKDSINVGSSVIEPLTQTDKITITAWIKPVFYKEGASADSRHSIVATNADISFSVYSGGNLLFNYKGEKGEDTGTHTTGKRNLAGGKLVPLNEFSHVAATRDGTHTALYLDGILIAKRDDADPGSFHQRPFDHDNNKNTPSVRQMFIGAIVMSDERHFDGVISDVGLWAGRALTPQQIALIAGLGQQAHLRLDDTQIDAVLAVFEAKSGSVEAGGRTWTYTTNFPTPTTGKAMAGMNYTAADGNAYIILDGKSGSWSGVMAKP
ncbi:MAG: LamG domain-containing protein [Phycisphaeraceae bacterium]|nr:LamG domain-containing protein [Phycisphaeraceae bacterium]